MENIQKFFHSVRLFYIILQIYIYNFFVLTMMNIFFLRVFFILLGGNTNF